MKTGFSPSIECVCVLWWLSDFHVGGRVRARDGEMMDEGFGNGSFLFASQTSLSSAYVSALITETFVLV